MQLSVIGTGYVGLVTGACLADVGHKVTCVDVNLAKIEQLRSGVIPFFEPSLREVVVRTMARGRLAFSADLGSAIAGSEAIFLAVGTPSSEDGSADVTQVVQVAAEIGRSLQTPAVIITKSTVPVGTAEKVKAAIQAELDARVAVVEFHIASNPEFLKEGTAVSDFFKPDRIVAGVESDHARAVLSRIYRPFILNGHPLIFMDVTSAEITKYAANAMLALRISYMNMIDQICEEFGADITAVRKVLGSDSRIGSQFLYAGIGYGGSCFPKDVRALAKTGESRNISVELLREIERINNNQKTLPIRKLKKIHPDLSGLKVALWGLAFKPNTDDMREAPSIDLVKGLVAEGATVTAFDPVSSEQARLALGDIFQLFDDPYDALDGVDALILVTEWPEFRSPDIEEMARRMRGRIVIDGRNVLDADGFRAEGFNYQGIGLRNPLPIVMSADV